MELIYNLTKELSEQNLFNLSVINEINFFVLNKINMIITNYELNKNNHYLLGNFVNLGLELENISIDTNNIISIQLKTFSNLILPIIYKLKEICLEFNLQIVNEFKNIIENIFFDEINNNDDDEYKKYFRYLQINCFTKILHYSKIKDISFEDFGINIKITNLYYIDKFKNLIESFNIFSSNKKNEWIWKAKEYNTYLDISNKIFKENKCLSLNNDKVEKIENFKIIQNITNSNESNNISINKIISNNKTISGSTIIEDESFIIPIDKEYNLSHKT